MLTPTRRRSLDFALDARRLKPQHLNPAVKRRIGRGIGTHALPVIRAIDLDHELSSRRQEVRDKSPEQRHLTPKHNAELAREDPAPKDWLRPLLGGSLYARFEAPAQGKTPPFCPRPRAARWRALAPRPALRATVARRLRSSRAPTGRNAPPPAGAAPPIRAGSWRMVRTTRALPRRVGALG